MSDEHLEQLLDGVWQRRRAELLQRATRMLADLELARAGDVTAWASVGLEAHGLTGALGSLGFDGAAAVASGVERAVGRSPLPDDALHTALRDDLDSLQAALLQASGRPR